MKKLTPMLATLIDKPFTQNDWLFEIKFDGFRAIAYVKKKKADLLSRNQRSFNTRFPQIIKELQSMNVDAILDGELVILDREGKSRFQYMQNYQRTGEGNLRYFVFDLLYLNGKDLRALPLIQRKTLLKALLKKHPTPRIKYSDHVMRQGEKFFKKASSKHLEGIIGKDAKSPYEQGRSTRWVKIKNIQEQEVVIGGYTEPRGGRKKFGSLLVGVYDRGKLKYAGHVGGGFDETLLKEMHARLKPLTQKLCPFDIEPKPNMPVKWVKPSLVCEVKFAEWTNQGLLRQPIFLGLRHDKSPKAVRRETPRRLI